MADSIHSPISEACLNVSGSSCAEFPLDGTDLVCSKTKISWEKASRAEPNLVAMRLFGVKWWLQSNSEGVFSWLHVDDEGVRKPSMLKSADLQQIYGLGLRGVGDVPNRFKSLMHFMMVGAVREKFKSMRYGVRSIVKKRSVPFKSAFKLALMRKMGVGSFSAMDKTVRDMSSGYYRHTEDSYNLADWSKGATATWEHLEERMFLLDDDITAQFNDATMWDAVSILDNDAASMDELEYATRLLFDPVGAGFACVQIAPVGQEQSFLRALESFAPRYHRMVRPGDMFNILVRKHMDACMRSYRSFIWTVCQDELGREIIEKIDREFAADSELPIPGRQDQYVSDAAVFAEVPENKAVDVEMVDVMVAGLGDGVSSIDVEVADSVAGETAFLADTSVEDEHRMVEALAEEDAKAVDAQELEGEWTTTVLAGQESNAEFDKIVRDAEACIDIMNEEISSYPVEDGVDSAESQRLSDVASQVYICGVMSAEFMSGPDSLPDNKRFEGAETGGVNGLGRFGIIGAHDEWGGERDVDFKSDKDFGQVFCERLKDMKSIPGLDPDGLYDVVCCVAKDGDRGWLDVLINEQGSLLEEVVIVPQYGWHVLRVRGFVLALLWGDVGWSIVRPGGDILCITRAELICEGACLISAGLGHNYVEWFRMLVYQGLKQLLSVVEARAIIVMIVLGCSYRDGFTTSRDWGPVVDALSLCECWNDYPYDPDGDMSIGLHNRDLLDVHRKKSRPSKDVLADLRARIYYDTLYTVTGSKVLLNANKRLYYRVINRSQECLSRDYYATGVAVAWQRRLGRLSRYVVVRGSEVS